MILDLDKMSSEEKIEAIDLIWQHLVTKEPGFSLPAWHGEELAERERRIEQGLETFSDWEEAKARIWESVREDSHP